MTRTFYVASSNAGKLRDFRLAAAAHDIAVLPLPGLAQIEAPPEDEDTFEGNAAAKAIYYCRFLPGEIVVADDSGLEVDALEGAPGVRSARYASDAGFQSGENADASNNQYLLEQLSRVPEAARSGRYRCALTAAQDGQALLTTFGTVEGEILFTPRGTRGFGYDPLFYLPSVQRTMAEVDDETRWAYSHRGHAFRALLELAPWTLMTRLDRSIP